MKFVIHLLIIFTLFFASFNSIKSNANNLVIAPVNDPALKDLLIRTMFVDKKKRIYIGTDSGLYRYANNNLVKLDNSFSISANAFNGAISNIQELDDRYLAISAFLSEVIYFDRVKDGYVDAPYNINKKYNYITTEKITSSHWLWKTPFQLLSYSSINHQYKILLSTPLNERILNFKFNKADKSLYVMTQKGLYFSDHIDDPLKLIFTIPTEINPEYFSGASLVNNSLHYLSDRRHLTFIKGVLVSQLDVSFCNKRQLKRAKKNKHDVFFKYSYFFDISFNTVMAVSDCGVYQYNLLNSQLKALIIPENIESPQWLKGMGYTDKFPIILEAETGLFLIDNNGEISKLRNKTSASLGGSTFNVVKVTEDQYLIADGTPGLKIASSRLNQFNNLEQSDLERITGGHSLRDVIKIDNNTLWLGSQTNGLFKVVKHQGKWHKSKQYLPTTHVRSLYKDNTTLWVATEGSGLHQVNLTDHSISEIETPIDRKGLLSFLPLNNGQLLVGATNGVLVISKKENRFIKQIPFVNGTVWAMAQSSNGDIWLGSHSAKEGLFKLDSKFSILETYTYDDDLYQSAIMDMVLDEYEQPVLATWGGGLLYRQRNEMKFSQLNTKYGLLNDTIQSVNKLSNNQYWLSTEKGLAKVQLCQSGNCRHQVKTYTTHDGLSTNLFDLNSAHFNEDGSLIYGGFYGLTWFDPSSDIIDNKVLPSEHHINNLTVDGINITNAITTKDNQSQLSLTYDTQHINITFNSDDYINQNNKKYRYKINGSDWTVNQKPEINLSALAHGSYLIEAGSSNSDGLWAENNLTFLIDISPPAWLSFYAKLTYFITFIFTVYVVLKLRSAQLVKQNYKLERKVEEKTILLRNAIDEKEHMFESSSHELQTPLTLILNYLDLIPKEDLSFKSTEYLSVIRIQSQRLHYLVKNMLLNADSPLPKKLFILTNIINSLTTLIERHQIQACKANILLITHTTINQDIYVNLLADSDQVIFNNLIENAIKFSPNDTKIEIELFIKDNNFVFCISDQGPGFKDLNKIGTKYYRESPYIEGTGLGLMNVKNWVSKNNGTIHINNKAEEGCEIRVTLPLSYDLPSEMKINLPISIQDKTYLIHSPEINIQNPKILIVEDDTNLAQLFKETLAIQFNIQFCGNGQQAIQYLQQAKDELPEVIISDIMMPLMNGFELCQYLKKSDDLKHIPLLLLTAKSDNSSQQKGLVLGADDYINKPFEISSLQLKISNIIKTNKARKQFQLNYITIKEHAKQTNIPQHEFITQVKNSLKNNLNNSSYSITDLANSQNMSTSTLRRKLKQFFDQTFTEILKKSRMNKAKELLASDQQIQIIVEHCGYTSHSYFNKHFKEEFELSPKEIRADLTRKLVVS